MWEYWLSLRFMTRELSWKTFLTTNWTKIQILWNLWYNYVLTLYSRLQQLCLLHDGGCEKMDSPLPNFWQQGWGPNPHNQAQWSASFYHNNQLGNLHVTPFKFDLSRSRLLLSLPLVGDEAITFARYIFMLSSMLAAMHVGGQNQLAVVVIPTWHAWSCRTMTSEL